MKAQELILLNQMEVTELRRLYRNPIMWLFFRKSIQSDIDFRLSIIQILKDELYQHFPESHFDQIAEVKKFAGIV